jgi:hypothetical protein
MGGPISAFPYGRRTVYWQSENNFLNGVENSVRMGSQQTLQYWNNHFTTHTRRLDSIVIGSIVVVNDNVVVVVVVVVIVVSIGAESNSYSTITITIITGSISIGSVITITITVIGVAINNVFNLVTRFA